MSQSTSPVRYSGNFDYIFDTKFTEEIGKKMQVPDRIKVVEQSDDFSYPRYESDFPGRHLLMQVPDRILVAGGEEHIGDRGMVPEMHLENKVLGNDEDAIHLVEPPRTLTVASHDFPIVEEHEIKQKPSSLTFQPHDGYLPLRSNWKPSTGTIPQTPPGSTDDEIAILRREVRNLSRRVLHLEDDTQKRQQREVVLYALGVLYFVFKGLVWLNRNY